MSKPSATTNPSSILGCFVLSTDRAGIPSTETTHFQKYIWGERGLCGILGKLKHEDYGEDLVLVLFQFYVNPYLSDARNLKEIERYRKKERSIGIPILINKETFFNKSEPDRYFFLKQMLLWKMDVLAKVIRSRKLDTKIELLKSDLGKIFADFHSA